MTEIGSFSRWLEQRYLAYQAAEGRRITLGEFAAKMGISQGLLSHYLKGIRHPRRATVERLAGFLGDEIYAVLGLTRPDPRFVNFQRMWDRLDDAQREALHATVTSWVEAQRN